MRSLKSALATYLLYPIRYAYSRPKGKRPFQWYGEEGLGFFVDPSSLTSTSVVYSFGIGWNVSFDLELIQAHGCTIHAFDPTPKSLAWCDTQSFPSKLHIHPYGIGPESGQFTFYLPKVNSRVSGSAMCQSNVSNIDPILVPLKTFSDIAEQLGHSHIDVVKLDIEGSEYAVAQSILTSEISIDQIVLEIHDRFVADGPTKSRGLIKQMREHGYEVFARSNSYQEISFGRV